MPDVLIRDVPAEDLARIDGHAARLGLSRTEYLRRRLAERGQPRAPSVPDLIIAAIAESAGLVVLHNDKDLDLIADVTGQPVQRLDG